MIRQIKKPISISKSCYSIANIGNTWDKCWQALLEGKRAFSDGSDIIPNWPDCPPLAAILDFPGIEGQPPFYRRTNELISIVGEAIKDSVGFLFEHNDTPRISIIVATSHGDPGPLSQIVDQQCCNSDFKGISKEVLEGVLVDNLVGSLNYSLQRELPGIVISAACASSLVAISYAVDRIDAGLSDVVIMVAIDTLSRVASVGFNNIGAMSKTGCLPYDYARDGTTVGEGAVAIIMAKDGMLPKEIIAGNISGTATYCDAAHMVEPNPLGVSTVIDGAICQAGIDASCINGVFWHGTGTYQNDKTEAAVSEIVFGESSPPCTSTKGSLGHTMGASGGFNVLAACETNKQGIMPHVAGTTHSEYSNLNLVLNEPREINEGPMLITALGFGGINAAVIVTPS